MFTRATCVVPDLLLLDTVTEAIVKPLGEHASFEPKFTLVTMPVRDMDSFIESLRISLIISHGATVPVSAGGVLSNGKGKLLTGWIVKCGITPELSSIGLMLKRLEALAVVHSRGMVLKRWIPWTDLVDCDAVTEATGQRTWRHDLFDWGINCELDTSSVLKILVNEMAIDGRHCAAEILDHLNEAYLHPIERNAHAPTRPWIAGAQPLHGTYVAGGYVSSVPCEIKLQLETEMCLMPNLVPGILIPPHQEHMYWEDWWPTVLMTFIDGFSCKQGVHNTFLLREVKILLRHINLRRVIHMPNHARWVGTFQTLRLYTGPERLDGSFLYNNRSWYIQDDHF